MRQLAVAAALVCVSGLTLSRSIARQTHPPAAASSATFKPEIAALAEFAGSWACKGVFPSNGQRIESRITFASDLEGAWLSVRHDDLPPNRFHAYEWWAMIPPRRNTLPSVSTISAALARSLRPVGTRTR
jgi:hypothetical protein